MTIWPCIRHAKTDANSQAILSGLQRTPHRCPSAPCLSPPVRTGAPKNTPCARTASSRISGRCSLSCQGERLRRCTLQKTAWTSRSNITGNVCWMEICAAGRCTHLTTSSDPWCDIQLGDHFPHELVEPHRARSPQQQSWLQENLTASAQFLHEPQEGDLRAIVGVEQITHCGARRKILHDQVNRAAIGLRLDAGVCGRQGRMPLVQRHRDVAT
jgi:hypothetical protein